MGNKNGNDTIVTKSTARINAMKKHVTNKTEIRIGGKRMNPATILAIYQKGLDTRAVVVTKRGEYNAALADRGVAEAERAAVDEGLKQWVLTYFGAGSPEAVDFGFSPRKVTVPSAETKAKAARLNKATREARGTLGKKARLKIKGTLPDSTAPAAPATSPAPAPAPEPTAPAVGGNAPNGAARA